MKESPSIPEAIGAFLASFRAEHELTYDQIAKQARLNGASWSASSVRNIELGKAATSLQNLLSLGLALSGLADVELKLSDMLGDAKTFSTPSFIGYPAKREWVDSILNGEKFSSSVEAFIDNEKIIPMALGFIQDAIHQYPRNAELMSMPEPSLAEERAAQRIGMKATPLQHWAIHLWGKPLEEEAAARAAERSRETGKPITAQTKGAMTRTLIKEVVEAFTAQTAEKDNDGSPA